MISNFRLGFVIGCIVSGLFSGCSGSSPQENLEKDLGLRFVNIANDNDFVASHCFEFENTFDQPLELSLLRTSCGCTSFEIAENPVPVGETMSVSIKYDLAYAVKSRNEWVIFETNAQSIPQMEFALSVSTLPYILLEMESDEVSIPSGETVNVKCTATAYFPAESDDTHISLTADNAGISFEEGSRTELTRDDGVRRVTQEYTIQREPGKWAVKNEAVVFSAETALAKTERTILFQTISNIRVNPKAVFLKELETSKVVVLSADEPFALTEVTSPTEKISFDSPDLNRKKLSHELKVRCDSNGGALKRVGDISVTTDMPNETIVEIPVYRIQ